MILADKIIDLRKKNGWSQEDLAEKLDVSRQSISKWEGAQSVPDLTRIIQMAELFGVSTDYLLKDELEAIVPVETVGEVEAPGRTVTMEEANAFLTLKERNARTVALGVMFCILSPVLIMLLSEAQELGRIAIAESAATGLGLMALFLLIGGAVALFVTSGLRMGRYEYLEKEPIDTLYGVDGMVRERREQFRPVFSRQLTVGIVLCVVSVLPIFVSLFLFGEAEWPEVVAVAGMLCLIAVGVLLIVRVSIVWSGFQILLEEGDYSREAKADQKAHGNIGKIYWGLVTAVYLAVSFLTMAWDRTWIVWPVAAVAYGAVFGIIKALRRRNG
ncbi:MAG: helix-turn-helix transcriptional regulator [Oscillospiraceae bacterium]|nr:helix-turn-helix transcriptional regulator [Oscillospiraceae bacterium]